MREERNSTPNNGDVKAKRLTRVLLIAALALAFAVWTLFAVKYFQGVRAGQNANTLLVAFEEKNGATPVPAAPTLPPELQRTPEPSQTEPEGPDAETLANEAAAQNAAEHQAEDDSHGVDEAGEYVPPEDPAEAEYEAIIEKIVNSVGDDGVIAVLEIPELNEKLPVIGKWSYKLLKISVCRYKGPGANEKGNLVIIGHNYKNGSHFGRLDELKEGSELFLTGKDGVRVRYEVYAIKGIEPDAFSALDKYKGECGLTLMTCKNNGNNRLLVRCVQKEAAAG